MRLKQPTSSLELKRNVDRALHEAKLNSIHDVIRVADIGELRQISGIGKETEGDVYAALAPHLKRRRRTRFFVGLGIGFALWVLWPILMFSNSDADNSARWLMNELTFTVIHLAVFPCVLGLLLATIRRPVLRQSHWVARLFILIAILLPLVYFSYDDFIPRDLQPYSTLNTANDFKDEIALRTGKLAKADSQYIADRHCESLGDVWRKSNPLAWYKGITTAIYLIMIGVFIWHICAISLSGSPATDSAHYVAYWKLARDRAKSASVASFAMLVLWIPCRMYTSWYHSDYIPDHVMRTGPLFVSFVAAVLILLFLLTVLEVSHTQIAKIVGAGAAGLAALLTAFPDLFDEIGSYLARTEPAYFGGVLVLFAVFLALWAYRVSTQDNVPTYPIPEDNAQE